MRPVSSVIVVLFLLLAAAGVAQQGSRHGSAANRGAAAPPAEDSDTATFTRAIAGQATDEQIAQFFAMTTSTETARQQAKGVGRLANNSEELVSRAATLELSVYQALSDTNKLRRSFTDAQEATLKAPSKKLAKSNTTVDKGAKALSHQLEQIPPSPERLISAIANLQRDLEELQSDQLNLGKKMGIPSH
jgi:hypothetical protein